MFMIIILSFNGYLVSSGQPQLCAFCFVCAMLACGEPCLLSLACTPAFLPVPAPSSWPSCGRMQEVRGSEAGSRGGVEGGSDGRPGR